MSVREVTVRPSRAAGAALPEAAVAAAVEDAWRQLGLRSSPSTTVSDDADGRLVDVYVDGRLLAVSGRTRHEVAVAATGKLRALDEPSDADAFANLRFADANAAEQETMVCELVQAALRNAVGHLVASEAEDIAATWSSDGAAVELVRLTARLGIAPSQVDADAVNDVIAYGDADPFGACDELVDVLVRTEPLIPVVELSRSTLRRLTVSSTPFRPELIHLSGRPPAAPRSLHADVAKSYGVDLPDIRLAIAPDVPNERFRVRFGPVRTYPRLVLPEGCYAIETARGSGIGEDASVVAVDPVYGGWWPITDAPPAQASWRARYHDPAAVVIRGLAAELERRRAWWAPRWLDEMGGQWYLTDPLYDRVRRRLPAVLRWLLASGAAVAQSAPIVEGMLVALSDNDDSVAAMVRSARIELRGAALGPVLNYCPLTPVALDPAAVDAALEQDDPRPLLECVPELFIDTGMAVVTCDSNVRPRVEELLLGLGDTVRVAGDLELTGADFVTPAGV